MRSTQHYILRYSVETHDVGEKHFTKRLHTRSDFPSATRREERAAETLVYTRFARPAGIAKEDSNETLVYKRSMKHSPRRAPGMHSERVYTRFVNVGMPYSQTCQETRVS